MRITEVEIIPIYPRLVARAARTTPTSPTGTCAPSSGCGRTTAWWATGLPLPAPGRRPPALIGRSPFEFLGNDLNPGLGAPSTT